MKTTEQNLHLSDDGVYRPCRIRVQPCPFGARADEHVSVVDLATSGGAVIAEGHGHREVSPIIEEGFWIKAEVRRRGFHADGRPMRGRTFVRWLKKALESLARGV